MEEATMMNNAYRDDLEAALARASDLEREIEDLRMRNDALEAFEARKNARRLATAEERERDEEQRRDEQARDEGVLRRAAQEAARTQADAEPVEHVRNALVIVVAGVIAALAAGMTSSPAIGGGAFALLAIGLIYLCVAESIARKRQQKADER
jgi:Flp pilus assembly protein TadB